MDKLSRKCEEAIEKSTGLPIDTLRKIDHLPFKFYLQNRDKITLEDSEDGIYFKIKSWWLRIGINMVLQPEKGKYSFSQSEIETYLYRMDYRFPLDTTPRIDGIPIMSLAERKRIFKKLSHI